jgi:single-stranded-DNA-specific exonuclease
VRAAAGDGARIEAIAFRAAAGPLGQALMAGRGGGPIHLAGNLSINRWGGRERVQLRLVDAALPSG